MEKMGKDKSSPLPDHTYEESLVNDFANYFMSKIGKIREELEGYPLYKPQGWNVREFSKFRPFSNEEVRTISMGMKMKSCEIDPIPTELLKKMLRRHTTNYHKNNQHLFKRWCFCGYMEKLQSYAYYSSCSH